MFAYVVRIKIKKSEVFLSGRLYFGGSLIRIFEKEVKIGPLSISRNLVRNGTGGIEYIYDAKRHYVILG
jgi:hypothetical protein